MKKQVKAALDQLALLKVAEPLYFDLRTATPAVIWDELRPGGSTAPDGHPYPPRNLIYDVIACHWRRVYFESGEIIVDDMERLLESAGRPLDSFQSILDFGCGSSRLLRQIRPRTTASLYGSDYNPRLIDWCRANLPFAEFSLNRAEPPLPFEDGAFDFIYARSVLTHVPEDLGLRWMRELRRVLSGSGILYFTMHGRPLAGGLSEDIRGRFEKGEMVVTYASVAGENLCSTYAGREFVESKMLDGFRLVTFEEGRDADHLRQDIYLAAKA